MSLKDSAHTQAAMCRINVNGKARSISMGQSISELIAALNIKGPYAVEINEAIVPRSIHDNHLLNEGDRVEVVSAVGGG